MVSWGHWFALSNIVLALFISSVYMFSSPAPGSALGSVYMMANWLGHISFLTFFGFVIFILPACYLVPNEKAVRTAGAIAAAIGLAVLALDALIYTRTGFHISFSTAELVRSEAQTRIAEFGWQRWAYFTLLFFIWLGCQLIIGNAIWRRLDRLRSIKIGASVTSFFVTCFVTSHGIHIWSDASLYQPVVKQDNLFPFSYPATAKTTMSRYGLLDIDSYNQRKKLQFDPQLTHIRYPLQPIYCSVDTNKSAMVIVQLDKTSLPLQQTFPELQFNKTEQFYASASTPDDLIVSSIFGVPQIYTNTLQDKRPVLLALPNAQGMDIAVHYQGEITHSAIAGFQKNGGLLKTGIEFYFSDSETIIQTLENVSTESAKAIMVVSDINENGVGTLHSTLPINSALASVEDIAPTILSYLGCNSNIATYSTGRNLINPSRSWLVSTQGERILVIQDNLRIELMSDGSYSIIDIKDNSRRSEALDINLLTRAIKHLSQFSVKN